MQVGFFGSWTGGSRCLLGSRPIKRRGRKENCTEAQVKPKCRLSRDLASPVGSSGAGIVHHGIPHWTEMAKPSHCHPAWLYYYTSWSKGKTWGLLAFFSYGSSWIQGETGGQQVLPWREVQMVLFCVYNMLFSGKSIETLIAQERHRRGRRKIVGSGPGCLNSCSKCIFS